MCEYVPEYEQRSEHKWQPYTIQMKKLLSVIRLMKKFCRLGHMICVYMDMEWTHTHTSNNNNEKKG